jgi:hypothetical protein
MHYGFSYRHDVGAQGVVRRSASHPIRRMSMDEVDAVDELGPVDWIVVEFPGSRFNGQIAPALLDLVERDLVRVLDLLVLKKDANGSLEAFELSDLDEGEIGGLREYESELAMLLSEEDVNSLAAAIEPGSSAGVLVWENTWAAPFASAVRHSGGQLVASGRIPIQALLAAIEADEQEEAAEEGTEQPAATEGEI